MPSGEAMYKTPAPDKVIRASGFEASDSKPTPASVLAGSDIFSSSSKAPTRTRSDLFSTARTDMLLTPTQTPHHPEHHSSVKVDSIARTLFSNSSSKTTTTTTTRGNHVDPMPSPQRQNKEHSILDSFEEPVPQISIFTDTKERVPEKDACADNPFWQPNGKSIAKSTTSKASKAKVWIAAEGRAVSVNEACKRSDGQVRVL